MVKVNQMLMEKKSDGRDIECFVIYHSADMDGFGSGAQFRYYAENYLNKQPIMIPHNHDESIDWYNDIEEHDIVLMGDIAIPKENMNWLAQNTDFQWFDHHISSINEMNDISIKGTRNTKISATGLIFEYLLEPRMSNMHPNTVKIIELISDYDNWNESKYGKEEYKRTPMAFNVFTSSINLKPDTPDGYNRWVEIFEKGSIDGMSVEEMIDKGRYLQAFQDKKNAGTVKNNAFEIEFEGYRAIACFGVHGSQAFDAVYDENKHDIMISITVSNKKEYNISLYTTKDDVDVSLIAKKHGGGGHKGSSGFSSKSIDYSGDTLIIN